MIFILLSLSIIVLTYVYVKWRYTYWERMGVPCPEPTFLVGNVGSTLNMTSHISLLCEKWYRDYPNAAYTGYYKILNPGINLRDPDLVKDILIKDHFSFHVNEQDFSERFDPLMAHNPFVATNDSWRKGRTVLTPLLTLFKVRTLFPLISDSCDKLSDYMKTISVKKDMEAKALAARYTTQTVIRCSFSIDSQCFTDIKSEFRDMGKKIFQPTTLGGIKLMLMSICPILRDVLPFAWVYPAVIKASSWETDFSIESIYRFVPSEVDSWFRELIQELKESRLKSPPPHEDLFQMLLNSVDKNGKKSPQKPKLLASHYFSLIYADINDVELAGYALSLFVEGFETSSSVLGFAIYEMARNPDIQERLYEEIADVLAKHDGNFTFDALQEMEYLDMVIHETMRLDVVAPLISKKCTKEYTLPLLEGQTKPVTIYPGTPVQISARAIHM